jgi:hypothetical protein
LKKTLLTVSHLMQCPKTLACIMDAHVTGKIKKAFTPEHLYSADFRALNDNQAVFFVETLLKRNMSAKRK